MNARPLVSVITPTYDGEAFVAETVESVLAQMYEPVEHVLVDDGSVDGTPGILGRYQRSHPDRIRVVRNRERLGPCRRRNDALALARGELVAWLDHDDVWRPDKLERQVEALAGAAMLAYSQYEEFEHETGRELGRSSLGHEADLLSALFVEGCFVASSTVLFRRPLGLRLREAHPSYGDDYFLWLTLLLRGGGVLVDEPLTRLRRHPANESARLARENYHLLRVALLRDFLAELPEARTLLGPSAGEGLAKAYVGAAAYELEHGRRLRAAALAARAARLRPAGAAQFALRTVARAPRWARRRLAAARQGKTSPIP